MTTTLLGFYTTKIPPEVHINMPFFWIWTLTSAVIFHTKGKIIIKMVQNNKLIEERTEWEVGKSKVES